jgi:hypothetical protein
MAEKLYSSAMFNMLDRESQTEKGFMAYPITRVELVSVPSEENPRGLPHRVFVVDPASGQWREERLS